MKKTLLFTATFGLILALAIPAFASSLPVGGTTYYLSGAGINSTATSIQLTALKTADGRNITMSSFGTVGYGTLEPGTNAKLENIEFTGIVQNGNGTATLTGVSRGVDFVYPYAATPTLGRAHSGGATFIITNTASYYYNEFTMNNNNNLFTWPTASTSPAGKGYVDFVAFNGAAVINATTVSKGVVQLATGAQAAASTASGSSGASLALTSSISTSTRNAATSANQVMVTDANGRMDNAFQNPYASTTIAATSSAKLNLHGLGYNFPSVRGATSTALAEDGTGNLTWESFDVLLNGASSTAQTLTGSSATSTIYTYSLPGGLLGTNNIVKVRIYGKGLQASTNADIIDFGYANSTTTVRYNPPPTQIGQEIDFTLSGNGTTGTQVLYGSATGSTTAANLTTSSIDSTTAQNIVIQIKHLDSNNITQTFFATTELLRY